jgi:hypothetical protein
MKTTPTPVRLRAPALAALLLAATALAGCGSDAHVQVQGTTTISKGQQLTDLQSALAVGALTQSEYDKLRTIILKRPN